MSIHGFVDQNGQIQKYDYDDLENKPTIPAEVLIDDTLTEEGQAADAKAVGDAIANIDIPVDSALSDEVKQTLLNCIYHQVFDDEDGMRYYQALYDALYPPADLASIEAIFTQGDHVIYDIDDLSVLKPYLVVTAVFDDMTTETVPENAYYLSGMLVVGTSTITARYSTAKRYR